MRASGSRAALRRDAALGVGTLKEHGGVVRAIVRAARIFVNRYPVKQRIGLKQYIFRVVYRDDRS